MRYLRQKRNVRNGKTVHRPQNKEFEPLRREGIQARSHSGWISPRSMIRRPRASVGACMVAALALAGCGLQASGTAGGVAGLLARLHPLEAQCHGSMSGFFGWDFSGSDRGSSPLMASRLKQLRAMTDQVAACGGTLQAVAFSSSTTDTSTLAEAAFPTTSSTDTARLIQANRVIGRFMAEATKNVASAMNRVSPAGTDVLGELGLARQSQEQHPGGTLYVTLATDGIATTGPVFMDRQTFTKPVAEAAAETVTVPDLPGAQVRMVGVGKTAAPGARQLSTARTEALTAFYRIVCKRTGAASCLISTQ
jgi:hypothetical protein